MYLPTVASSTGLIQVLHRSNKPCPDPNTQVNVPPWTRHTVPCHGLPRMAQKPKKLNHLHPLLPGSGLAL